MKSTRLFPILPPLPPPVLRSSGRPAFKPARTLCLLLSLLLAAASLCGCASWAGLEESTFRAPKEGEPSIRLITASERAARTTQTEPVTVRTTTPSTTEKPKPHFEVYNEGEGSMDTDKIEESVRSALDSLGLERADLGLAFLDLSTGEIWGLNVDKHYEAASTIKMAAAMYTYEMAAQGLCDLSEELTVKEEDIESGAGPVTEAGEGAAFTLAEILHASIIYSDNTANHMVYRFWQDRCPERWLVLALDARYNLRYNDTRGLNALEGVHLMQYLFDHVSTVPMLQTLMTDLQNTTHRGMATATLPVAVAHKYGKLGSLYHDIGIAFGDKPFAFAVFTDGLEDPQGSIGQLCLSFYNAFTTP